MKKVLKILLPLSIIFTLIFSCFSFTTLAAGSSISFSSSSVTVGQNVTVRVTLNAGQAMYGVDCGIRYNSAVLKYVSGNAVGSGNYLKIVESLSGQTSISYSLTFQSIAAGSAQISVSDAFCSGGEGDISLSGSSATLTVKNPALSSNANLKSLSVSAGRLSPRFSVNRTTYNVSVANSVTSCAVYASTSDSGAKFTISGSNNLKIGDNKRVVTVTAPSGATKSYTIIINRSATEEVKPVEPEETPEETPVNPLETTIDGAGFTVATDISSVKLFKGFEIKEAEYNGTKVAVAADKEENYKIYYLAPSEGGNLVPYTYDEKEKVFTKLLYLSQNDFTYIFAELPKDKTLSENFYKTNAKIAGMDINCFADSNNESADFYYIYCFSDGRYGMYRYDTRENVLQRYPELKLDSKTVSSNKEKEKEENIISTVLNNFKSLSTNAKIVVLGVAIAVIVAITLIVLLIIKLLKKNNDFSEGEFDSQDDFESVTIEETFTDFNDSENVKISEAENKE